MRGWNPLRKSFYSWYRVQPKWPFSAWCDQNMSVLDGIEVLHMKAAETNLSSNYLAFWRQSWQPSWISQNAQWFELAMQQICFTGPIKRWNPLRKNFKVGAGLSQNMAFFCLTTSTVVDNSLRIHYNLYGCATKKKKFHVPNILVWLYRQSQ